MMSAVTLTDRWTRLRSGLSEHSYPPTAVGCLQPWASRVIGIILVAARL
jgi:hypothetical protein